MAKYDPRIIYQFADRLYSRAYSTMLWTTVLGAFGGAITAFAFKSRFDFFTAVFACVGGLIGYLIGKEIAFWLKLRAQTSLCQVQIEANTRSQAGNMIQMPPLEDLPDDGGRMQERAG